MFNAIKSIIIISLLLSFAACKDNSRADAAAGILEQAHTEKEAKNYHAALALLDTLDTNYKDCLDARRQGSRLRIETRIDQATDSLAADSTARPDLQERVDRLGLDFIKIGMQGTDGYYVHNNSFTNKEMNTTGIQARVDDKGYFFVAVNLSGRKIGLNALRYNNIISLPMESLAVENSEIMSLPQECVTALSEAIANAPEGSLKLELIGTKGNVPVTLSAKQAESYRQTWIYAKAVQELTKANARRAKYERQLTLLQQQLSTLPAEPVEKE